MARAREPSARSAPRSAGSRQHRHAGRSGGSSGVDGPSGRYRRAGVAGSTLDRRDDRRLLRRLGSRVAPATGPARPSRAHPQCAISRGRSPSGRRPGRTSPTTLPRARSCRTRHQRPEVAGVEELDVEIRIQLAQPAQLAVLLADELLPKRRHLEVEVEVRQVESGEKLSTMSPSRFHRIGKVCGSLLPTDRVEVEDPGNISASLACANGTLTDPPSNRRSPGRGRRASR